MSADGTASRPLISIIVATFDAASTLPKLLDSLRAQTFHKFEVVVIDGGSGDGTPDLLEMRASELAYWISEPDQGIYDAWNKALPHATGEWVLFLGADDCLWSPSVLQDAATRLSDLPSRFRIAYGQLHLVNDAGAIVDTWGVPWPIARTKLASVMPLPNAATFYRRKIFHDLGPFDTTFTIAGDYEFALRELLNNDAYFLGELVVAGMGIGGVSTSPKSTWRMIRESLEAQRRHGTIALPPWLPTEALIPLGYLRYQLNTLKPRVRRYLSRILGRRVEERIVEAYRVFRGRVP